MPEKLKTVQRVMSGHPVVSAALWHVPSAQGEAYARDRWFVPEDLAECEGFTHGRRIEEWLAARIALKTLLVEDGLAESPLHIHIRKNGQGSPHVVVYNPETGAYARLPCSLSHKGPLVLAAYSRLPGIRVGIDLERRSWKLPYLRRRFISEHDKMLEKDDQVGDCTALWAFKEAVSKLLGAGMAYGFANIHCRETSLGTCELRDAGGNHYAGAYGWFGRYALALVTDVYHGADADKEKAKRRERPWYERIVRARRLRDIRRLRRVSDQLAAVKAKNSGNGTSAERPKARRKP
ncbi:MAG: 4'-phosphopantetheinyl transferase superfamily protein [Lentisphaerae bacterium]|nr:4'-phosphopantetheinyl transferase superfamily protein [Lentisphaerota bacterium]